MYVRYLPLTSFFLCACGYAGGTSPELPLDSTDEGTTGLGTVVHSSPPTTWPATDAWTGAPWEPVVCTTTHGKDIVDVDMQTGEVSVVVTGAVELDGHGLARLDDAVVVCGASDPTRVDLATGVVSVVSAFGCGSAADMDGELWVLSMTGDTGLYRFATWDDFAAGSASEILSSVSSGSRLGRGDSAFLTALHASHQLDLWLGSHAKYAGYVELEDFDTWVSGISAVGDRWFVSDAGGGGVPGADDVRIAEFNPDGAAVQDVSLGQGARVAGLSCRPAPAGSTP